MRWLMTAQSELDSSTGDHIPKTILAPIHLSLQGKQKLYAIIHGLLYVMYDHTICFFIYTSLYIYIYIHVLLQATVDGSELWHWICLKFPFRLVKFCFGRGRTHVCPPLPSLWPDRPVSTVKNQVVNASLVFPTVLPGFNKLTWARGDPSLQIHIRKYIIYIYTDIYLHLRTHYLIAFFSRWIFRSNTFWSIRIFQTEKERKIMNKNDENTCILLIFTLWNRGLV